MFDWRRCVFHQLIQAPRPDESKEDDHREDRAGPLVASLTGAHADLRGEPDAMVVTAWVRPPADERLRLVYAGRPYFPPAVRTAAENGTRALLFPPGALATDL